MLPVQRNRSIWQHGTDQRHAGTGGSNGAVAQLVARFVRIEEVGSSTLLSSTKIKTETVVESAAETLVSAVSAAISILN